MQNMQSMTLEQLRTTFSSGGLSSAQLIAQGRKFFVTADTRTGARVVLVVHSSRTPRMFGKAVTALKILHDIGFRSVGVELANWTPDQGELTEKGE